MKNALFAIFSLLLVSAASSDAANFLKARVTGTVQTQTLQGLNEGRIRTSALNNASIFEQFGVSPADYELVVAIEETGLYLLPRTQGALPTLTVVRFNDDSGTVVDTRKRAVSYVAQAGNTTATNLFEDFAGTAVGLFRYTGEFSSPTFKSGSVNVMGKGTDNLGEGSNAAILKFKITTTGTFTQQPGI